VVLLSRLQLNHYIPAMCGRYSIAVVLELLRSRFELIGMTPEAADFVPRYNVAPTQDVPIVTGDNGNRLVTMRWGLVPSWAKEESIGNKMINARGETLTEKPSFRNLIDRSRVIVPVDGFYEWKILPSGKKAPVRIRLKDHEPFGLAGLSDRWKKPDGSELRTFTIITVEANSHLRPVHDRMPAILPRDSENPWLDMGLKGKDVLQLLKSYPSEEMEYYEVSPVVNSPRNDSPVCIEPVPQLL
jgi:putative SOS response-associated peptidase YedK